MEAGGGVGRVRREREEARSGGEAAEGRPHPAAGTDRLCVWSRAHGQLSRRREPGGRCGPGAGGARRPGSVSSLAPFAAKLLGFAA